MKNKVHLFDSKEANILWSKADDGTRRGMFLYEIYPKVPKELRYIYVSILELHIIKTTKKLKKKALKWLNHD